MEKLISPIIISYPVEETKSPPSSSSLEPRVCTHSYCSVSQGDAPTHSSDQEVSKDRHPISDILSLPFSAHTDVILDPPSPPRKDWAEGIPA